MENIDEGVRAILDAHAECFTLLKNGKIQCTLNQHTMPARLEPLQKFVSGPKFARMKKQRACLASLKQYEPFLIPSQFKRDFLFCTLTNRWVKANLEDVKRHMKGTRFQKRKGMFLKDEVELMNEPEEVEQEAKEYELEDSEACESPEELCTPESLGEGPSDCSERESSEGPATGGCLDSDAEMAEVVCGKDEKPSRRPKSKMRPKLKRRKLR